MISRPRGIRRREGGRVAGLRGAAGVVAVVIALAVELVVFVEPAAAQPPTTAVLVPSNNATVSGTNVVLDASASAGTTSLEFAIVGGSVGAEIIGTATDTVWGWASDWDTTTVPDGSYYLLSYAFNPSGSTWSSAVSITVDNPLPTTTVVLPANDATLAGNQYLDAIASSGVTSVVYEISGGPYDYVDQSISGSTPTYVGWIGGWNTASWPNGTYTLNSVASYAGGTSGTSPPITIVLNNPATLADLNDENSSGTGNLTTNVNGCSVAYFAVDMYEPGSGPVSGVDLHIAGCYNGDLTGSFTVSTQNAGTLSGTASGSAATITPTPGGPMCPTPSSCQPPYVQFTLTLTVTAGTGSFAGATGSLLATLDSPASAPPTDIPFTGSITAS
jgi:hypothetical protein